MADSEAAVGGFDGPLTAQPLVIAVVSAFATGIGVGNTPDSLIQGNVVHADATALAVTEAIVEGPGTLVDAIAANFSQAQSRGIAVRRNSDRTQVLSNNVASMPMVDIFAVAADEHLVVSGGGSASSPTGGLLRATSHAGDRIVDMVALAHGEGISVFSSLDALIKGNVVAVNGNGHAVGQAIEDAPLVGDSFSFGSVFVSCFGIMQDFVSDGSKTLDNVVSADCGGVLDGLAEAVTREDPLVVGEIFVFTVGIDNFDTFESQIRGNDVSAHASSDGSAVATELVEPLVAEAFLFGLAAAVGILIEASHDVLVAENLVDATASADSIAIAVEQLDIAAEGASAGFASAAGILGLGFLTEDSGGRGPSATTVETHSTNIRIIGNRVGRPEPDGTLIGAVASSHVIAVAEGFDNPALADAFAFAEAVGIGAQQLADSVIKGNTIGGVDAIALAGNELPPAGSTGPLDKDRAHAFHRDADIGVFDSGDILVAGNVLLPDVLVVAPATALPAKLNPDDLPPLREAGIAVESSSPIRVRDNDVSERQVGLAIFESNDIFARRNNTLNSTRYSAVSRP